MWILRNVSVSLSLIHIHTWINTHEYLQTHTILFTHLHPNLIPKRRNEELFFKWIDIARSKAVITKQWSKINAKRETQRKSVGRKSYLIYPAVIGPRLWASFPNSLSKETTWWITGLSFSMKRKHTSSSTEANIPIPEFEDEFVKMLFI